MFKAYSDGLIRFYDVQAFIVPPLSIVCCAILVLVVFRHTPRQMGALKWYIIASSICSLICELLLGLGHPLTLFPYPYMLGGGILPALNFSQDGYHAYAAVLLSSFVVMTYANAAMFVFRFGQTVDSSIVKWMAKPRYGVGIAAATILAFSVGLLLPLNFLTISPDDVRASARDTDIVLYNLIKDRPFIGIEL